MLPAVVALMAVLLMVGSAAVSQISLVGAARAGARAAALGESDAAIRAAAQATAPLAVNVRLERGGGLVRVTCTATTNLAILGHRVLEASAAAACEPARGCG
jgi:hypothetical protein